MKSLFFVTPVALLALNLVGCTEINSALETTNKVLSSTSQVLTGSSDNTSTSQSSNPNARVIKEFVVGDKITSQYEIKDLKFTIEDWGVSDYVVHTTGTFYNKTNDSLMVYISAPKYDAEGYATGFVNLSVGTGAGDKTRVDNILNRWDKKDYRIDVNKVKYTVSP